MYRKCLLYWGALLLVLGLSPTTSNRPRTTGPPGTLAAAVQNRTGSTNTGPVTRVPSGLATDSDKASKPVVPKRLLVDGFPKEPLALENGEHGQEDDWVKTLVLTVRNVSGKPIYFAEYTVTLPEIRVAGGPLQIPILYGNPALRSAALPGPKDKPLGENKVIKLRISAETYKTFAEQLAATPPTKLVIRLKSVSFGDGTGWANGRTFTNQARAM